MSINIIDTPLDFQPVYSDGLFFTVSADTTNTYSFRYVYDLYVNDELVFQGKATPNPYDLGVIDVSRILTTYTENNPVSDYNGTPIYTHQSFPFSRPYTNETISYEAFFGYEYSSTPDGVITGFTGNGNDVGPPTYSGGLRKVFYSTMGVNGRATQQDFNMSPFILSGNPIGTYPTTSGLFLTNSPRIRDIQSTEYYTLGFTNYYLNGGSMLSEPYYVEYKFYDDQGVLLDTQQFQNILDNGGGPLPDCTWVYPSYYTLVPTGNTEWNTLYVGAGPMNLQQIMPADTAQYTVQLFGKFTGSTSPPSLTPTPTPTPTPTNACPTCYRYQVENPSTTTGAELYYLECPGSVYRRVILSPSQIIQIDCACAHSLVYEQYLIVSILGTCNDLTPTPTPTLTPTPTSCACNGYTITNTDLESQLRVDYVDCNLVTQVLFLNPGLGTSFCACSGSVAPSGASYDLVDTGACVPDPTPTPTMTSTPSATIPTEFTYYYQVQDCDNPLLFTVVGSNTFYPIGRILRLNNGSCAEIVGTDLGPHFFTVIGSYLTCESCPR